MVTSNTIKYNFCLLPLATHIDGPGEMIDAHGLHLIGILSPEANSSLKPMTVSVNDASMLCTLLVAFLNK